MGCALILGSEKRIQSMSTRADRVFRAKHRYLPVRTAQGTWADASVKRGKPARRFRKAVEDKADRYGDLKPKAGEPKVVAWDDDVASWSVFGTESGFCYRTYSDEGEAERSLR